MLNRFSSALRLAKPVAAASRSYLEWSTSSSHIRKWTANDGLINWVLHQIKLLQPSRVHLCDGSEAENEELLNLMVQNGQLVKLNEKLRPGSYLARSSPADVARVEERTFICSETPEDAGFTNNWKDPQEMSQIMTKLFEGSMKGRTMYVIPFSMGPIGSHFSQLGVQITDSPYVVVNMRMMTRMGSDALKMLSNDREFIPCIHSVGAPLARTQQEHAWPSNEQEKYIVHFPEQRRIWSYGSGYGGNALLGKKCFSLRIATSMAREEGWLAEHMLIVGITNPKGVKKYFCAAFPSACGKTNMAMLTPSLPGWKVETVGDDIAWLKIGSDGRLWAINPEAGFFGVAPGTSAQSNPNAMKTLHKNTIFTNVALKPDGDVWWEGMGDHPGKVMSWLKKEHYPDSNFDAAHPNARFTVSASQCPSIDPDWESKEGVPISGIIFGGRRSNTVPLVYQARNWEHGVFVGATMNSETTAAAVGKRGLLRNDPFAMRPFCGYNLGEYFQHWLSFSERTNPTKLPKIFHVNWFRKSHKGSGKFLWPGFGENIRVIEWMFDRCDSSDPNYKAVEREIGYVPAVDALNTNGLNLNAETMEELTSVNADEWIHECKVNRQFLSHFGSQLPPEISHQLDDLQAKFEVPKKH